MLASSDAVHHPSVFHVLAVVVAIIINVTRQQALDIHSLFIHDITIITSMQPIKISNHANTTMPRGDSGRRLPSTITGIRILRILMLHDRFTRVIDLGCHPSHAVDLLGLLGV